MKPWVNWVGGCLLAVLIFAPAIIEFRSLYAHHKRLREVTPGKFYRSGQMTAEGFRDAIARLGIRTVINLQGEFPDPALENSYWSSKKSSEKQVCEAAGARYIVLDANGLRENRNDAAAVPEAVDGYLKLLDDPTIYPVLIHCRAGLHRTGLLTAVYRMEYEGWSHALAADELKANGFNVTVGRDDCTAANDYVRQYLLNYRRRESGMGNRESGLSRASRLPTHDSRLTGSPAVGE
jgi:protein tyrosine/serine phosphatase